MPSETEKNSLKRGQGLEETDKEMPNAGKSWFFGIGINEYEENNITNLNNAAKDVEDIISLLEEKYEIDEKLTLFNENATRDNILWELEKLVDLVEPSDKLLIYFSGHGYLNKNKKGYWIPFDGSLSRNYKNVSNVWIKDRIEEIHTKHTFLIADACFSGSILYTKRQKRLASKTTDLESFKSRLALSSGRNTDLVDDGEPGENSPFARCILETLESNHAHELNFTQFASQVRDRTKEISTKQTPTFGRLNLLDDEGGEYIFRLRRGEEQIWSESLEEGTVVSLSRFLSEFRKGKYAEVARERIIAWEEEDEFWKKILHLNRISAFHEYLDKYSNGRYVTEANKKLKKLHNNVAPSTTKKIEALTNTFVDPRDGQSYKTVELNGKTWIAENFNYDIGDGSCYINNDPMTSRRHGRLYTWEGAMKACPPGWRLPSDEEFKTLAASFGGYYDKLLGRNEGDPFIGFTSLRSAFLVDHFAGYCKLDKTFDNYTKVASYWTDTNSKSGNYINYDFDVNSGALYRTNFPKELCISCRYIKEDEPLEKTEGIEKKLLKESNVFTDPRDDQTYKTIKLNGLRWMAQNLCFDVGDGCWFYDNNPKNGEKYGRLYTWQAAEKACPPGWRLPTDEEWKSLAKSFGGFYDHETKKEVGDAQKGYATLIEGGSSGLSAQLGGGRISNGSFFNLGDYGYYWSATELDSVSAWYYFFYRYDGKLSRSSSSKAVGRSCRCVQDLSI